MAINPYQHVARLAKLYRSDPLPKVTLPPKQRQSPNLKNPQLAATRPSLKAQTPPPPYIDVVGQPSVTLRRTTGGGVEITVRRRSRYADDMSDGDLKQIEAIAQKMLEGEKSLSRGNLSYAELRKRGHPYGRGARRGLGRLTGARGVSNMAVVNRHGGTFERGWEVKVERGKAGVSIRLTNDSPHAARLAFGTARMRAHGPFTTAVARELFALNRAWAAAAKRGYHREMAMRGF
jgi:hypothetical protein